MNPALLFKVSATSAVLAVAIFVLGCVNNSPVESAFVDVGINTVILELTNVESGEPTTYQWQVTDGELQVDRVNLVAGVNYAGEVSFLDTLGVDLTNDIAQSPEEFLVSYGLLGGLIDSLIFNITDMESDYVGGNQNGNNLNVGLKFYMTFFATITSNAELRVTLNHYDRITKNDTNAGDDIFIAVGFPVTIEIDEEEPTDP
ncbi:hypothetical protein MJD09_20225 [bacterium]|nr:hypothetical protein [bacterium]